ncbi:MAG: cytochrome P450 [Chloroflexota bacterium]|nr:cytochrome P450 [Chloroflexota bacterium]
MALGDTFRSAIAPLYIRGRLLQERIESGVAWYPLDPEYIADPYPTYRKLRERDPYHESRLTGMLIVSRYEDVDAILRDHRRFRNSDRDWVRDSLVNTSIRRELTPSLLSLDPPDHTRLRGLVNRAFTPRVMARMEDHVRATAHALLDEVGDSNEFDLMSNLATLLPMVVIAEMIGVPTDDRQRFKTWSDRFARVLEPNLTAEEGRLVLETADEFERYFAPTIEERRREPREDLVSRLAQAEEDGQKLTNEETQVTLRLLLVAGNETTTNLIGNGLRALLQHPEQLQLLREQPELIPNAIEELLRYDAPVQLDGRYLAEDVEIGGKIAKKNSRIGLTIGGANRDPEQFSDPDRLDLTREETVNISFGRGIHHCLGAPLARLEGRIAFEVLLERFDEIEFGSQEPVYKPNIVLRGLRQFPIQVRHRGGRSFALGEPEPTAAAG